MPEHLARGVGDQFHLRPSFLATQYADPSLIAALGDEKNVMSFVGSSFLADIKDIASADAEKMAAHRAERMNEVASSYGFGSQETTGKPFVYQDGVAVIPIHGLLVNRFSGSWGFITGYNFIRSQMNAALEDADVKLIVYDVNSFGGSAAGCSELSEDIFNSRSVKPSIAVIDAHAYSAGIFLASSATKVVCTPSGGVGSIGTIIVHMSVERALKDYGVDVTFIHAGLHKPDGSPLKQLTKDAKALYQQAVDDAYEMFVAAIARNRDMDPDDVRNTEAKCYSAIDAKALNLIDAVEVPSRAVATFLGELANDDPDGEEDDIEMTVKPNTEQVQTPAPAPAAAATPTAPVPAASAGLTEADIDARIKADRQRSASIRGCDEAKGREALASHLADQGYSLEEAKGILAVAPKAAEPDQTQQGSHFHAAMDRSKHPEVGADGKPKEPGDPKAERETQVAATADAIFGKRKQ